MHGHVDSVCMWPWYSPKMRIILCTDNGLNGGPKRCFPPEHMSRTIFGKRVSVDVVKDLEVRLSWVRVALDPVGRFLIRDKKGETQTQRRRHVKMKAEMAGMQPQTWGSLDPQKLEKTWRTLSWSLWRDFSPATTWSQASGLRDWGRMNSCCFKPPSLWLIVRKNTE